MFPWWLIILSPCATQMEQSVLLIKCHFSVHTKICFQPAKLYFICINLFFCIGRCIYEIKIAYIFLILSKCEVKIFDSCFFPLVTNRNQNEYPFNGTGSRITVTVLFFFCLRNIFPSSLFQQKNVSAT